MKTLLLIHGMFMTPDCWKDWIPFFESKGYKVVAPAWPRHERPVSDLVRAHPDSALGMLDYGAVVAAYDKVLDSLREPPIVVGHSMGGLVAQTLLAQGRVAAAIALEPAPPAGVRSYAWSHVRSNFALVNPFVSAVAPIRMDLDKFSYVFVNGMGDSARAAAWSTFAVPESRLVARTSGDSRWRIDFAKTHAPLLLVAGGKDQCIPASLVRKVRDRYVEAGSGADYVEFDESNHFITGFPGWEKVASFVANWIDTTSKVPSAK